LNGVLATSEEKMSIVLYVLVPIGWALLGKVLGWAISATCFFSARGNRIGQSVSRWCVPIFPVVIFVTLLAGAGGDAGHGITLFDSAALLSLVCLIPFYGVPALALAAGVVYVIRDLTLGHFTTTAEAKP
jgi:hypothetical protein